MVMSALLMWSHPVSRFTKSHLNISVILEVREKEPLSKKSDDGFVWTETVGQERYPACIDLIPLICGPAAVPCFDFACPPEICRTLNMRELMLKEDIYFCRDSKRNLVETADSP